MSHPVIDLRSDTVTSPGPEMRAFMAQAPVGDDVYGEDPTVNQLEKEVAQAFERDDALYVPTGCMSNQIALQLHTQPGDEVFCAKTAHMKVNETGAGAAYAGVQMTELGSQGFYTHEDLTQALEEQSDHHHMRQSLVLVENATGGRVWPQGQMMELLKKAQELGMKKHLDGARIWNAAVASKASIVELSRPFDSVSVCLSKGLGAPVGSLLLGSKDFIARARRIRKRMGGGMRQVGIIGAGGLFAFRRFQETQGSLIAEDHGKARQLAAALESEVKDLRFTTAVETNMIFVELPPHRNAFEIAKQALTEGVILGPTSASTLRLVTHMDLDPDTWLERSVQALGE